MYIKNPVDNLVIQAGHINRQDIGEHLNNVKERPARITTVLKAFADGINFSFILVISVQMTIAAVIVLGTLSWSIKFLIPVLPSSWASKLAAPWRRTIKCYMRHCKACNSFG